MSQPLVSIVMGSDSDLPVMTQAADMLAHFKIPFELDIVSAHRTPEKMVEFAKNAAGRGIKVIIAGAGGAAHLPGMIASLTPLPVIGVPVKSSSNATEGWILFCRFFRCLEVYLLRLLLLMEQRMRGYWRPK